MRWAGLAALALSAIVVCWPILTGGHATYLDNPAHLAEIDALAAPGATGWSDLAMCGFPLAHLHSPLWYGILARAAGLGLPWEALYRGLVVVSFLAPALALFWVAGWSRSVVSSMRPGRSALGVFLLAYALLMQPTAIVGFESALGGMWTWYLGAAAVLILAERLCAPPGRGRWFGIAVALGIAGLSHTFALTGAVVLLGVHFLLLVTERGPVHVADRGRVHRSGGGSALPEQPGPAHAVEFGPAHVAERGRAHAVELGPAHAVERGRAHAVELGPAHAAERGPAHAVHGSASHRLKLVGADLSACVVAAVVSAAYWLPLLLSREVFVALSANLDPGRLLLRLLLPTDMVRLHLGGNALRSELVYTEVILTTSILVLGGIGTVRAWRANGSRLGRLAGTWSLVSFALLWIVHATGGSWLGPLSWRLLYLVRIGFAIAAVTYVLGRIERRGGARAGSAPPDGATSSPASWVSWATVLACVALSLWWGTPLRRATPDPNGSEMRDVRALWDWLENDYPGAMNGPGRVYLQDTFGSKPPSAALARSHVLARTAPHAGVEQLGAWYGALPYPTSLWTRSEFGSVCDMAGKVFEIESERRLLVERLWAANVEIVVLVEDALGSAMEQAPEFEGIARIGRFRIVRFLAAPHRWVEPLQPGMTVASVERRRPGEMAIRVEAETSGALAVRESWHPFWQVEGAGGERIERGRYDLIHVEDVAPGRHELRLHWAAPTFPAWISGLGWLGLGAGAVLARRRRVSGTDSRVGRERDD